MHETTWNNPTVGNTAPARHGVSVRRYAFPPGCGQNTLFIELSRTLAAGLQKTRDSRFKTETGHRTPGPSVAGPKEAAGTYPAAKPVKGRLRHGCLDAGPHSPGDRDQIWGAVHPAQYLEDSDRVGLELPETGKTRAGAGRKGHSQVETLSMAAYKKRPNDLAPIWYFLTRAVSSLSQTWFALGRPGGRHHSCVAQHVGERFPPSPPSVFRQGAGAWPSMRDFTAVKTLSLRKLPGFLGIFSGIFADLSCCSGIPGCRIEVRRPKSLSVSIPAFRHSGSRAMHQSLTRMNMCGAILSARLRTASRRIFASLSGLCIRRSRDCGSLKAFCGAVFTHPSCHGVSVSIT